MSLEQNGHYTAQTLLMLRVLSFKETVLIPELTGVSGQILLCGAGLARRWRRVFLCWWSEVLHCGRGIRPRDSHIWWLDDFQ